MESDRPAEPGHPAIRFIVWHAPGSAVPADLSAALDKRHIAVHHCTSPFAAMAEVCALDRAMRPGENGRAAPAGGVVLVLVKTEELEDAAEVVKAVELYAPRVHFRRYEPGSTERFTPVGSADLELEPVRAESAPPQPTVVVMPDFRRPHPDPAPAARFGAVRHPAQRTPLRLAGEGTLPERPEPDSTEISEVREGAKGEAPAAGGADRYRQVLTPEELTMLLSEDTVEPPGRGGPEKRAGDSK